MNQTRDLYQCATCTKLYPSADNLICVNIGKGAETTYYLCEECAKARQIIGAEILTKSLNSGGVTE